MNAPAIEADGLRKAFGQVTALDGLSFQVPQGSLLGLLGPDAVPQAPAERLELLRACLRAQRKQMIERFGPYLELATIAETLATPARVAYASDQYIHDLAVWYHLAWLGETVRRSDPLIARLTERGRDFSAAQRRELLTLIGRLVAEVVPRYRRLAERGQVELSVTPYAHPIIPLLIDFAAARAETADTPRPLPRRPRSRCRTAPSSGRGSESPSASA